MTVAVEIEGLARSLGGIVVSDKLWDLAQKGHLFVAVDDAMDDKVTGQTSFSATTPTFLLRVPADALAMPLFLNLSQAGTVAGAAIDVLVCMDVANDRYASGGTEEKVLALPPSDYQNKARCYTGATASAVGRAGRIWGATIGQDVSPAEGAVQGPFWKPEIPYFLKGPASLLVYTYAGTTGPTWYWSLGWAEFSPNDLQTPE